MTAPPVTAAIIRTVALTLRQVAGWAPHSLPATAQEWTDLAVQVENLKPGWSCPMCEEVTCDDGCPLELVRAGDSAALRQLVIDGQVTAPGQDQPAAPPPIGAALQAVASLPRVDIPR